MKRNRYRTQGAQYRGSRQEEAKMASLVGGQEGSMEQGGCRSQVGPPNFNMSQSVIFCLVVLFAASRLHVAGLVVG